MNISTRGLCVVLAAGLLGILSCNRGNDPAASAITAPAPSTSTVSAGLYPDIQTVVPTHLQIVNPQQQTILRFSNGIANTGDGPFRLRPEVSGAVTNAVQEILDADGNVVLTHVASAYEFHPEHNHWHITDIALFEVRAGSPTGPIVGSNSRKVTFCLIDWYKLDDNAPASERTFWDCGVSDFQGISAGWVDQYHHSLEGQDLDLTGVPAGRYYLVSTSNFAGKFLEQDLTNNTAWVSFDLTYNNSGNAKIDIVGNSPCSSPGMCGENSPNR